MSESKDGARHGILSVLRRRFCGCKRSARTTGMEAHCRDEEAVLPRAARDAEARGPQARGREKDGRLHARNHAPLLQAGGARDAHAGRTKPAACRPAAARARGAAGALRPTAGLGRTYQDGHDVPAPGDRASCRGPRGTPVIPGKSGHRPRHDRPCARGTRTARAQPLLPRAAGLFHVRDLVCPVPGGERRGRKLFERPQARVQGQRRGQAVDAHKARPPGRRHEHEPQGARQRHAGGPCKAVRGPEEPRHRMHRRTGPTSTSQERARVGGLRPMEAAGACFEHPDKQLALIRSAADYNGAAGLGAIRQARGIRRSSRGFRQGRRSSAPRVLDRLKTAEREF